MRWTTPRSHGPPRIGSNKDRRARRHAGRSEASSHSGAWELVGEGEKERGEHMVLLRASLKLEWWCGDGATVMKWRRKRNSTAAAHKLGGWGKRRGEGVVRSGRSHLLFIEARGWCGEAATMVGV
jgi:hypothetical protein